ncbi:Gfo/Idh/MocA family protein [Parapedobacter sp. 10938]|uniref:Gfo/Idh/MocA family protein n=1 Tax=Parapedobacter flavus TaxID=3110225 RepID=UPI002DB7A6E1|nr:Gfo/Idh/MocA family oxidoreductase [Parapedobacter sp. 10938]MEC3881596.1 Gfo/Idh/MocA family oxidoreductase [Parapedobacter sp. 10938]
MEVKWGIIGAGDVTEVKSGPAFQQVEHSHLVAVMRRDGAKAKSYAERHGVPRWCTDAQQLMDDPEVNAIYVATPPDTHLHYATAALRAGKPVYLEKPMTLNREEAKALVEAQQASGVKLSVAHYRREQPYFKKVKELIDGHIGTPRIANLRYYQQPLAADILQSPGMQWRLNPEQSGGGLFHDLAPHQIDLMHYFFGDIAESGGMARNQAKLYGAADVVSGQVWFENGVLFNGQWAFNVAEKRDVCEVIGSEGKVSFSVFDYQPIKLVNGRGVQQFNFDPLPHVQQPMIAAVVSYIRGVGPNPCSVQEGCDVMKVLDHFVEDYG